MKTVYEIMYGEKKTVRIDMQGHCKIYDRRFMPYNLYPDDTGEDIDRYKLSVLVCDQNSDT